ncbi:hypothetical protein GGR55DRAFT_698372 [Xylaria sp. FL0064]|nr:hypothetical protein GGR55DRAFT_698372 [Xylaria sp. FL0064]
MQFFKSLLFAGLLSIQALGATVPILISYGANFNPKDDIAPLPSPRTYVDINESRREQEGYALWTNGLATCIAVVVRDQAPRQAQEFDKILAHVASKLCTDAEGPGIDDQIANIFALHDQSPFQTPEVYQQFNEYVVESVFSKARERNFIYSFRIRDQSDVDKDGGSRLWIDGSKSVYWSQNMKLYGPPPA